MLGNDHGRVLGQGRKSQGERQGMCPYTNSPLFGRRRCLTKGLPKVPLDNADHFPKAPAQSLTVILSSLHITSQEGLNSNVSFQKGQSISNHSRPGGVHKKVPVCVTGHHSYTAGAVNQRVHGPPLVISLETKCESDTMRSPPVPL